MRGLNGAFLFAFYHQKVGDGCSPRKFNFHRALALAHRGWVFPMVKHFEFDKWFKKNREIPSQSFPNLRSVRNHLRSRNVMHLFPLDLAKKLKCVSGNGLDMESLGSNFFPTVTEVAVHANIGRLCLNPLPNLEQLLLRFRVTAHDINTITRTAFPKLKVVIALEIAFNCNFQSLSDQRERLAVDGIILVLRFTRRAF